MKKLLVGSVYAPDVRNATWLRLQLQFLNSTVGDFDHVVFANRTAPELFTSSHVLGVVPETTPWDPAELTNAMNALMRYFSGQSNYENYLMIDSDAFPFKEGWIEELYRLMAARPDQGIAERSFASPVRCENLDSFPHGCAFFAKGAWFREHDPARFYWEYMPATNFMGVPSKDVTLEQKAALYDSEGKQEWLPLMRTNSLNLHPILGAIYGNVFYHHGAGSRPPQFRAMMQGAYENFADQSFTERRNTEMFGELAAQPQRYLRRLTSEYPARRSLRFW